LTYPDMESLAKDVARLETHGSAAASASAG
jgi:hypothetical protein